jgi:hypothetical protein
MVQTEIAFIWWPLHPSWDSFVSTQTSRCCHVSSVPPWNLCLGFEARTRKPSTRWFCGSTHQTAMSSVLHTRPRHSTHVTFILNSPGANLLEPRSTCTSAILTQSTRSLLHVHLCLLMSLDVIHRGWSPGLPVRRSKPHVHPSPLSVHRHSTSLLDLHIAVDHRIRAPHLRTTSQETSYTT